MNWITLLLLAVLGIILFALIAIMVLYTAAEHHERRQEVEAVRARDSENETCHEKAETPEVRKKAHH